jgi:hypothetical protein
MKPGYFVSCLLFIFSLDVSIAMISLVFRAFLSEQTIDQLASSLKKGGIKDIASFFPPNKRDPRTVEVAFKAQNLPQISEWYIKRQHASAKESLILTLKEMRGNDENPEEVSSFLAYKIFTLTRHVSPTKMATFVKQAQSEIPLPDIDLIQTIWQGFVSSVDWNAARPDQVEGLAVKELTVSE